MINKSAYITFLITKWKNRNDPKEKKSKMQYFLPNHSRFISYMLNTAADYKPKKKVDKVQEMQRSSLYIIEMKAL